MLPQGLEARKPLCGLKVPSCLPVTMAAVNMSRMGSVIECDECGQRGPIVLPAVTFPDGVRYFTEEHDFTAYGSQTVCDNCGGE